jgi:hypothetical protein
MSWLLLQHRQLCLQRSDPLLFGPIAPAIHLLARRLTSRLLASRHRGTSALPLAVLLLWYFSIRVAKDDKVV